MQATCCKETRLIFKFSSVFCTSGCTGLFLAMLHVKARCFVQGVVQCWSRYQEGCRIPTHEGFQYLLLAIILPQGENGTTQSSFTLSGKHTHASVVLLHLFQGSLLLCCGAVLFWSSCRLTCNLRGTGDPIWSVKCRTLKSGSIRQRSLCHTPWLGLKSLNFSSVGILLWHLSWNSLGLLSRQKRKTL